MIEGSAGDNTFWESPEQWGYIFMYLATPITAYSAYFHVELSSWVWYFCFGVVGYTIGGRWIFEWVLAVRAGTTKVETETTKVSVEKKEVKTTEEKPK